MCCVFVRVCMLTHAKLTFFYACLYCPRVMLHLMCFGVFSPFIQDVVYQSLQSVVDCFREAVGIPLEKKYNSVLFGGISE